ncbi:hypothetical protein NDU88_001814 [Pleurodeles waltl]|uniref:Uncharacterized protein n=1 Tax=Pleurodeles waltl TaxID=8319 RepID=A0AAV7RDN6_PLEWA|nr:hypothetical protein NDU88_001814 [Pleurodeles waltl]
MTGMARGVGREMIGCPGLFSFSQGTANSTREGSAEHGVARYLREEEEVRPRPAGWTNEGQESGIAPVLRRRGKTGVGQPPASWRSVLTAGWKRGQFSALQHPPAAAEQRHPGIHNYIDDQPGSSGL